MLTIVKRFSAAAALSLVLAPAAFAEEVTLTSIDGKVTMTVDLISHNKDFYVVISDKTGSRMTVPRAIVTCDGAACPTDASAPAPDPAASPIVTAAAPEPEKKEEPKYVERREPDLIMVGSDRVGEELMSLTVKPYAKLLGGTVGDPAMISKEIAQYSIRSNDGEEILLLEVESTSSGPGLEALIEGKTNIAMSSRAVEDDEVAALLAQGRGNLRDVSQEHIVAVDSIQMIVHASNPVDALSRRQLADIYSGRIKNWAEVGGRDMPIMVVARPGGSARRIFYGFAFRGDPDITSDVVIIDGGKKLTRHVMANPGAIGYTISDNVLEAKPIDLILDCGIRTDATPFKAKSEEYLLGRRLRLYTDNRPRSPELQKLLDMMISPDVDELVAESGYYDLGIEPDPNALARLVDAALLGQRGNSIIRAARNMEEEMRGATRLSMTFRFETASWVLDNKALRDMDRLVEYLGRPENANRQFIFVGFADSVGQFDYNTGLSRERAAAVLKEIRFHRNAGKIGNVNMIATGFGELAPVGCNDDFGGRSLNRRVEVWVR